MKLAISGKGGVGKTTVASALVRLFSETHRTVYAIDADPDVCLASALGIPDDITNELKPLVEMKELISTKTGGGGSFYTLNPDVSEDLDDFCIKHGNIRYLRMGGVKKGGSQCYCRENTFLHAVVSSLLLQKDDAVIMDMGAGIEHLSRGTARGVDLMLVVVEPSHNSVNTAGLVKKLAGDLGIKKVLVIGNKIRQEKEKEFILSRFHPGEVLGFIGFDEDVWESAMEKGAAKPEGALMTSMRQIQQQILREVGE
ncbi:MAG: AAA family ATPase [Peptococcaceae bacterium]|nr:AAA family ATPase [Peptococcaceae bacterium]